eukprot:2623247-Amphidinium_carterae.2
MFRSSGFVKISKQWVQGWTAWPMQSTSSYIGANGTRQCRKCEKHPHTSLTHTGDHGLNKGSPEG